MIAVCPPLSLLLNLDSPDATAAFAARLGDMLGAGDTLLLEGPIGAGKTHFARALIQSRLARTGAAEDVPSPTYTLVQVYEAGPLEIWHADLYRLTGTPEVVELGLDEAFTHALCLVEWPDRLGELTPPDALRLTLHRSAADWARRLEITAADERWRPVLEGLAHG